MPDDAVAENPFAEVGLGPMWVPFGWTWNWGRITLADMTRVPVLKLHLPTGLTGLAFPPPPPGSSQPSLLDLFVSDAVSHRSGIVIAGNGGGLLGG